MKRMDYRFHRPGWSIDCLPLLACACACSTAPTEAHSDGGAKASSPGNVGSRFGAGPGGAEAGTELPVGAFVLVDTGLIVHERDYLPLSDFVNPNAPTNWEEPVAYKDGNIELRVEIVSAATEDAEFYYTVTWFPGAGGDEFLRPAIHVNAGPGVYESRYAVADLEQVVGGVTPGMPVGDNWTWSNAFRDIAGDLVAWPSGGDATYPVEARVRIVIHPPPSSADE